MTRLGADLVPLTVEKLKKEHSGVGKFFCILILNIFHAWSLSWRWIRSVRRDLSPQSGQCSLRDLLGDRVTVVQPCGSSLPRGMEVG